MGRGPEEEQSGHRGPRRQDNVLVPRAAEAKCRAGCFKHRRFSPSPEAEREPGVLRRLLDRTTAPPAVVAASLSAPSSWGLL